MKLINYFITAIVCIAATSVSALEPAHEASPGIILYNQFKFDAAFPILEKEAQSGNIESQYYLGEALRKRNRHMTPEAQQWYEKLRTMGLYLR